MALTVLENGEQYSEHKVYSNHIKAVLKAGTQSVVIEECDTNDDPTDNANWVESDVSLGGDEANIKPIFTSKGFYLRFKVDHASTHDCVVAVDLLNEPAENRRGSIGN